MDLSWIMYAIFNMTVNPYHPCMVYLPTFTTKSTKCTWIYHTWMVWDSYFGAFEALSFALMYCICGDFQFTTQSIWGLSQHFMGFLYHVLSQRCWPSTAYPYFGCYAFDQFSGMCILHQSICEHTVVTALYSNGLSSMGYTAKVWQFAPLKWWLEDDPASFLGFGNFSGANSLLNFRGVSSGYHWKMNNKIVSMLHGHRVSPPFWPFAPHKTADFLSPIQTISRAPKLSHRIHIWYIYLDLP